GVTRSTMVAMLAGRKASLTMAQMKVRTKIAARLRASGKTNRSAPVRKSDDSVREPSGERRGDECAEAVNGHDQPGPARRQPTTLRQVENQERQRHRPDPIDEGGGGEDPQLPRQLVQSAPRVHLSLRRPPEWLNAASARQRLPSPPPD